jgi:hypothetical protein
MVVLKQFWWITKIYLHKHILVTCLKTGTSSVCQFYDSPRQLICFLRTFFRVREADLLKSTVQWGRSSSKTVPMVCQDCPDRIAYTSSSSDRHTVLHTLWVPQPETRNTRPPVSLLLCDNLKNRMFFQNFFSFHYFWNFLTTASYRV